MAVCIADLLPQPRAMCACYDGMRTLMLGLFEVGCQ